MCEDTRVVSYSQNPQAEAPSSGLSQRYSRGRVVDLAGWYRYKFQICYTIASYFIGSQRKRKRAVSYWWRNNIVNCKLIYRSAWILRVAPQFIPLIDLCVSLHRRAKRETNITSLSVDGYLYLANIRLILTLKRDRTRYRSTYCWHFRIIQLWDTK